MAAFFNKILAKINAVIDWFASLFVSIFAALWSLIKDGFSWLFDQILSVAVAGISSIDVSAVSAPGAWGTIPGEVLNIMQLLGVGTAVAIITGAIVIRFILQLIPFVRLGS